MNQYKLSNNIPVLYFPCEYYGCSIWFVRSGDCIDESLGVRGISHMIEHIYVKTSDNYYTNGVTLSSTVSFIGFDLSKSKFNIKKNVYHYLNSWFFDADGNVKDLIKDHNIEDRIRELDNETYLKSIKYGDYLSVSESIKENKYVVYSKFEKTNDAKDDGVHIKKALYRVLKHMLDSRNIILACYGPKDNVGKMLKFFNHTFGKLKNSGSINNINSVIHDSIQSKMKNNNVLFLNSKSSVSILSSYFIPVNRNSILLNSTTADSLSTEFGTVIGRYPLFECKNGVYKYYIELKVLHNSIRNQKQYYNDFDNTIKNARRYKNQGDRISIDDVFIHCSNYSFGITNSNNQTILDNKLVVFLTHNVQNNKSLMWKFETLDSTSLPSVDVLTNISNYLTDNSERSVILEKQKYNIIEDRCNIFNYIIKYDASEYIAYNPNLTVYWFPMSYENIITAIYLQTIYPSYIYVYHNMLIVNDPKYRLNIDYLNYSFNYYDMRSTYLSSWIINTRTYCIMENINYMDLIRYMQRLDQITPSFQSNLILYNPPNISFSNNLYMFSEPFKYFIHVYKNSDKNKQISSNTIIRDGYKNKGLIYWGEVVNYGKMKIVKAIML